MLAVFLVVLIRNAWVTDDAYITFRVIENFLHGYGLVYNVGYRVQAYTHPLWMLMLTGLYYLVLHLFGTPFWGGLYYLSIFFSIVLTIVAICLLMLVIARGVKSALLGALVLLCSKAFIDYTTSGLENPLTYFLLVLFLLVYLIKPKTGRYRLLLLSLIASLLTLNRFDTLLLVLPMLLYAAWKNDNKWGSMLWLTLGFLPFILWEIFSLFYYGFLFPNTAYAKLNTGVSQIELSRQGILYLLNSLKVDPLTMVMILFGMTLPIITRKRKYLPMTIGGILYLVYIIRIGGDFMSGRYLGAPLLLAVCTLSRYKKPISRQHTFVMLLVLTIGFLSPNSPLLTDEDYGHGITNYRQVTDDNRITDEHAFYYQEQGLLLTQRSQNRLAGRWIWGNWQLTQTRPTVRLINTIGRTGYRLGPNVHIVDYAALVDPLLSKLPAKNLENWVIGHFNRSLPPGYLESVEKGGNLVEDPDLKLYYQKLLYIISGELWDWERLCEVWKLNTGQYDHLIERYLQRQRSQQP